MAGTTAHSMLDAQRLMNKAALAKKQPPQAPGVYFFLGPGKKILYIGKATNLRERVKSYFALDLPETRGAYVARMVEEARSIDWRETESVLEALLLEAHLIKHHQPPYNTDGKDDKSYNHLIITREDFPRVLVVREKDLVMHFDERDIKYQFGPYPEGRLFKEALKIIRRIFPFYDTKHPVSALEKARDAKLLFNRSLGIYPPAGISAEEYARTIRHLKLFFEGKKKELLRELRRDMRAYAKKQEFEKAAECKRQIAALEHIHDVSLMRRDFNQDTWTPDAHRYRMEAYDVAHLGGSNMVGVMTVLENGAPKKSDYRKFIIRGFSKSNDTGALREVLARRFKHEEWPLPKIIVVDGGKAQMRAAEAVLEAHGYHIPIVSVVKDERHRPKGMLGLSRIYSGREREILLANAEAHRFSLAFHRLKRSHALGYSERKVKRGPAC